MSNNNNNDCIIANIKWEDRGILLGIIYHILKKYKKLKYEEIYIADDKFRAMLQYIFSDLEFTKKKRTKDQYIISIKNIEQGNLNINNINNLENIQAKKYYLLPWYDNDNPIIMYIKGKKTININDIKQKINITTCHRGKSYGQKNYITDKCYNIWDTQVEYIIFYKYCEKFGISMEYIYELVSNYLLSDLCLSNTYVPYPVAQEVPTYIPYEVQVTKEVIKEVPRIIRESSQNNFNNIGELNQDNSNIIKKTGQINPKSIKNPEQDIGQYKLFMDLINNINNKISTINKIIDTE
jgi:hypothetical protein